MTVQFRNEWGEELAIRKKIFIIYSIYLRSPILHPKLTKNHVIPDNFSKDFSAFDFTRQ
jgi:hypothetical protein